MNWLRRAITNWRTTIPYVLVVLAAVYGIASETSTANQAKHAARDARAATVVANQNASEAKAATARIAQERIDRTLAECVQFNTTRVALIATNEAVIRIAVSNPPAPLNAADRLLLAQFEMKANREIERATQPKSCTIIALGLQPLVGIAQAVPPSSTTFPQSSTTDGNAAPELVPPTTVPRPPATVARPPATHHPSPPTTVRAACVRVHGRCHPKG